MSRCRYAVRAEPLNRRVPTRVKARLIAALAGRFEPSLGHNWDWIDITSIPKERGGWAVNQEMHRRLGVLLDEADPSWRRHYIIVPYIDTWPRP